MRNLQTLTSAEEAGGGGQRPPSSSSADLRPRSVADEVWDEVTRLEEVGGNPADVSPLADAYVGGAIRKNFHPETGRIERLRRMGEKFLSGKIVLTDEETVPARHLGELLRVGGPTVGDLFVLSPAGRGADVNFYDGVHNGAHDGRGWLRLLKHAASLRGTAAKRRIWNCGLSDAGLHNLFLDGGRLLLFDLGEPKLEPIPAFLTKFFMSFFHTLGMEDREGVDGWVCRFRVIWPEEGGNTGGRVKLALTRETEDLLPGVYSAFGTTLDRMVTELFDGEEEGVRGLIIKYVIVQLLSDAAFCLDRWEIKGGGSDRAGNHQRGLEKWLWRALWDLYIAWDVGSTLLRVEDWSSF